MTISITTVICWLAGAGFLIVAYKALAKDKPGMAYTTAIFAACAFFCGVPWVQGLAQTWIQSTFQSTLKSLGDQVRTVQATTATMQTELSAHQGKIDTHQNELNDQQGKLRQAQTNIASQQETITNQYRQLLVVQSELAIVQTNIIQQQKKIEDVEFLVNNLFSKMTTEYLESSDTNAIKVLTFTNGSSQVFLTLKDVPIQNSVQVIAREAMQFPLVSVRSIGNVAISYFNPGANPRSMSFSVQYVKDTRISYRVKRIEFDGTKVLFDGVHVPFTQDLEAKDREATKPPP